MNDRRATVPGDGNLIRILTEEIRTLNRLLARGGLGEVNPDYASARLHSAYDPDPRSPDPRAGASPAATKVGKQLITPGPPATYSPEGIKGAPWMLTAPKPFKSAIARAVNLGVAAQKLDTGMGNRSVFAIHNLSDNGVWINFNRSVGPSNGEFLPGSPVPGDMLGAFWTENLDPNVQVWGLATAANSLVLVTEFGL